MLGYEQHAYRLFRRFAELESKLKQVSGLVGKSRTCDQETRKHRAQVDWPKVVSVLTSIPDFVERIPSGTRELILDGPRNRPRVQFRVEEGGRVKARFLDRSLPEGDVPALIEAMKRVRNNLFHGGKGSPHELSGDDERWVEAATNIAKSLLDLVDSGELERATPPSHNGPSRARQAPAHPSG